MSDHQTTTAIVADQPSYLVRVVNNDAARKGVATAAAGILVACVSEFLWPSS